MFSYHYDMLPSMLLAIPQVRSRFECLSNDPCRKNKGRLKVEYTVI